MNPVVLVAILALGATLVALAITRLRPPAAATRAGTLPSHLSRHHFVAPDHRWLVAMFTAESCLSCAQVVDQIRGFESPSIAVQNIEVAREPALHKQYAIESVPTTLVVDREGLVRLAFVGPLSVTDRTSIAELTSPASTEE